MKMILVSLIVLLLPLGLDAVDAPDRNFIQHEGTYQIAPEMTLTISRDISGSLHYSFDRLYRESHATGRVKHEDLLTAPFLFYWDGFSQVLWQATARQIIAHTPEGMTVYDHTTKSLEHTPKVFRDEISGIFK